MHAELTKTCLLAIDTPDGPRLGSVTLAMSDTLEVALQRARAQQGDSDVDWLNAPVGIWGQLKPRSAVPAHGDRIELYRLLSLDPRQRRRQRARAAAKAAARPLNSPAK